MDEAAFWAAIAAAPDDGLPKLVFADWLDEREDPRSACLRWIVAEHKRPAFDRVDTKTWDWWSRLPTDPTHYRESPRQYLLALNLFTRLTPVGAGLWKGDPTYAESVKNLCGAWRQCQADGVNPCDGDRPRIDDGLAGPSVTDV